MNDSERRQFETLTRVQSFGAQHATLFPASQLAGELMAVIGASAEALSGLTATHTASAGKSLRDTEGRAARRAELREDLGAINRTAHAMAVRTPGLENQFRVNYGNDQELLALARSFVLNATPLKSDFVRYGMAEDFLDDLNADILAFEEATAARSQSRESQKASTAEIDEAIERGMNALKELDAVMRNVLRNDVGMLTAWMTAAHIERAPRKARKPSTPNTPGTPPAAPAQ